MVSTARIPSKFKLILTNAKKMTILLNTVEIKKAAKNNYEAEIVLTFALSVGYNKIISTSFPHLKNKLHISGVPEFLFIRGYLKKYKNKIVSNFRINEPQCYMNNPSWLHLKISAEAKSDYLYILGQRSLHNKNRFIPEYYVENKYWNNPLVKHSDRILTFILEK
jgi:hypothetical protein|tara:strand:+ start:15472 stop:15966 length:495 start_codon:yes stop_codon:yes gene_type:complete